MLMPNRSLDYGPIAKEGRRTESITKAGNCLDGWGKNSSETFSKEFQNHNKPHAVRPPHSAFIVLVRRFPYTRLYHFWGTNRKTVRGSML